jgi:hypothetical protein
MPARTATRTAPAPRPAAAFTLPPIVRAARSFGIRFVGLFCGAGGSSTGLVEAGPRSWPDCGQGVVEA